MVKELRIAIVVILALAIILSCTVMANKMTDPATYAHTIEVLDQNRTRVLGLAAASAAAVAPSYTDALETSMPVSEQIMV